MTPEIAVVPLFATEQFPVDLMVIIVMAAMLLCGMITLAEGPPPLTAGR